MLRIACNSTRTRKLANEFEQGRHTSRKNRGRGGDGKMTIHPTTSGEPDTKTRILDVAGPLFARSGFTGTTVREICRAAGVNVASIKYYFGDKESLYLETVRLARALRADRYPFPDWSDDSPAENKLFEFVSALLRRLMAGQAAPWSVQLLMRELMEPSEACRTLVAAHFQPVFESLLNIIDQLTPQPLSRSERLKVGFSIIGQCLHYRFGREVVALLVPEKLKNEFGIEQLASHITQFTLAALRADVDLESLQNNHS